MTTVVTTGTYEAEVQNSKLPVMIDFYADWCGPCQALMPIVEELSGEYDGKVKIVKVNVDDSPELSEKFGVMSIPTLIFLKDGEESGRHTSSLPKDALAEKLDAML